MQKYSLIKNQTKDEIIIEKARWCDSYLSKLKGFMFTSELNDDDGLVLVHGSDSRLNSAIHMMFVPFDLGVIWVNQAGVVVDKVVAKSWALNYSPKAPAQYVIEVHPERIAHVEINDKLEFEIL